MRISLSGIPVDDQKKAKAFYVDVLGFQLKNDIPMGEHSWLTVVSPEDPDGCELALEPNAHAASKTFQAALKADGIPITAFTVGDIAAEHKRLAAAGVTFTKEPTPAGPVIMAVFDDTCGNLVQIYQE